MVSIIHAMDYASQVKLQHFFLFSTDDNFTEQQYQTSWKPWLNWSPGPGICVNYFLSFPQKYLSPEKTETN